MPATVDGIVRDLCLAAPAGAGLSEVADHAGCAFLAAQTVREAIRSGAGRLRSTSVLVTGCGALLDRPLLDELSSLLPALNGAADRRVIKAVRDDLLGRMFPATAPAAALLAPRAWLQTSEAESLAGLARSTRPARTLRARIWLRR